jgi:hypothetical protein
LVGLPYGNGEELIRVRCPLKERVEPPTVAATLIGRKKGGPPPFRILESILQKFRSIHARYGGAMFSQARSGEK